MIPILILAAGQSRRMGGRDKLAEPVNGTPLLRQIASAAVAVAPTYVALPALDSQGRRALLDGLSAIPLLVPDAAEGQSGTLRGAVAQLPPCDAFLVVLGDLPRIGTPEMQAVLYARTKTREALIWRGATADGRPGHPILFDSSLRPRFAELSGDEGGAALVKPLRHRTVLVPYADDRALFDLDTPEDWASFRASGGPSGHEQS